MAFASTSPPSIPFPSISPSAATRKPNYTLLNLSDDPSSTSSAAASSSKLSLRVSAAPKARFVARRKDSVTVLQLQRPLSEYMSLPASQYSVLDAERIETVDEETFRCYVYRFKFFAFEVCPVLVVQVEVEDDGCSIKLLSCKLEGSPIVVAQNDKFDASMTNRITYSSSQNGASPSRLTSDAVIEVNIEIPFAFRAIPMEAIESTGTQILDQILKMMLPRFMSQLVKDYQAWASGDTSRQPLGTDYSITASFVTPSTVLISIGMLTIKLQTGYSSKGCVITSPFA